MRRRRKTERYVLVELGEGEGRSIRCWCLVVAMVGDFVVEVFRSGMISLILVWASTPDDQTLTGCEKKA
jgi:hypothetical protein